MYFLTLSSNEIILLYSNLSIFVKPGNSKSASCEEDMLPVPNNLPWNEISEWSKYFFLPSWYLYANFIAPSFASAPELGKKTLLEFLINNLKK